MFSKKYYNQKLPISLDILLDENKKEAKKIYSRKCKKKKKMMTQKYT